jgi:CPA2 family monovalent cation:H+ antiporter-2
MALKLPSKVSISIAILLSQIGEFSFVLAKEGMKFGLMTNEFFSIFLGVSILTMSSTPFLEKLTPKIVRAFSKISYFQVMMSLHRFPKRLRRLKKSRTMSFW